MGYVWIFQRPPHRIFPTELQFSNRMLISFFHCLPQHLAIPAIESEFPAERITYSRISLPVRQNHQERSKSSFFLLLLPVQILLFFLSPETLYHKSGKKSTP